MSDDVKPYTTPAAVQDAESRVVFELEGFPALIDYVRRLAATACAGLTDTERLDWLEAEAFKVHPVAQLCFKRKHDRMSHEWTNGSASPRLEIDEARQADKGMQCSGRDA